MAIPSKIPGSVGYGVKKVSSMDKRAIGKLTSSNHLESLHSTAPTKYDRVIRTYTQTGLFANDFQQMLDQADPFYLTSNSDSFTWDVEVPYEFPRIIDIPATTLSLTYPGRDSQPFQIVLDTNEYVAGDVIGSHPIYSPRFHVQMDPTPYDGGSGWLYTCTLLSSVDASTDYVQQQWIRTGLEMQQFDNLVGEWDVELSSLGRLGQKLSLQMSLSAGYGASHKITEWAEERTLRDAATGKPLDIIVYQQLRRNETGKLEVLDQRWEALIDMQLRRKMMMLNVKRKIWGQGGYARSHGGKQELKKASEGIYYQIRNNGNLIRYNRGQFSINLLREGFGDLFYRRVEMSKRKVKIFTNEAGFDVFRTAAKNDLLNSGWSLVLDGNNIGKDGVLSGNPNKLAFQFGLESVVTMETGRIEIVHLLELDLPQTNSEFGQNKKSTPIFMVFDISPDGDGTLKNNFREVRHKNRPSMTWGYVDGTIHHLGFAKSMGMSSANSNPWYELWMKDRSDVFVEDTSRCVIIEEIPTY